MTLQVVTLEDRHAVYALLDRYLDWLPPAKLAVRRAEDGAATLGAGRWRRCETCDGKGRVQGVGRQQRPCRLEHLTWPVGHGCRPCPAACQAGYVRMHGANSVTGTDRMIKRVVGKETGVDVTASYAKSERRRSADAQLLKIAALERQRGDARDPRTVTPSFRGVLLAAESDPDELTRAHDAKERQWHTGSFAALDRALELLALSQQLRFEALHVFVIDQHFDPAPPVRVRLDEIVDWLAARMPRPILLPADAQGELAAWKHALEHGRDRAHAEARAARDRQIVDLVELEGWSRRRVADVFDLSHTRVARIVADAHLLAVASGPAA